MRPASVPHLFALSQGADCAGPHRCVYCAAPADESRPASTHLKGSFTGIDSLPCPGSPWVCAGCVLCLREEATVALIDGSSRHVTQCAMRAWSWVVTAASARAASKAHLAQLRALCLDPPAPPFALCLSDSGQKQLLYRGVVNHGRESVCATLEGERVRYAPPELAARLDLCGRLVAATGKPALAEPPSARFALAVMERYPGSGERLLLDWERLREDPLSRLAAWLSGNRDACREQFPAESPDPAGALV